MERKKRKKIGEIHQFYIVILVFKDKIYSYQLSALWYAIQNTVLTNLFLWWPSPG